MPIAIYALTALTFVVGLAEFVIAGILPNIASDLMVSVSAAGYLITIYAAGVVVFSPLAVILILKLKINNKPALLALLVPFVVGNLIAIFANNLDLLLVGRVISSIAHGAGFGIAAVLAMSLAPKGKEMLAVSILFTGLTFANVIGVPIGTFIGQNLGWRYTFVFVVIISIISFIAILTLIKKTHTVREHVSVLTEIKALGNFSLVFGFINTIIAFAGVFLLLTHIASIFTIVSGIAAQYVGVILMFFGVALLLGNLAGGKLADKNLSKTFYYSTVIFAFVSFLFYFAAPFAIASITVFMIWGFLAFLIVPVLQGKVMQISSKAPNLISTFNIAAFNLGITLGSAIANLMIANNFTFNSLALVSGALSLLSLITFRISSLLGRSSTVKAEMMKIKADMIKN